MDDIVAATLANEARLREMLGAEVVETDLTARRGKMAEDAFTFLRATYWRWVEVLPRHWAPSDPGTEILAVGDIHLENFGTWRDAEGRLVWGVNDFDEAAAMPWPLDLIRLATSAVLAQPGEDASDTALPIAAFLLRGYAEGLADPRPIVLDHDFAWLRAAVMAERSDKAWDAAEKARDKFWAKMPPPDADRTAIPPPRLHAALLAALPPGARAVTIWPRSAGAGSLGRPRWVARATWQGGPLLREAKAMLPSAWVRGRVGAPQTCRAAEAARGAFRAPDPCLFFGDGVAVRRLSPNNSKFEADKKKHREVLFAPEMLGAMGRDLAAVHAATEGAAAAIRAELAAGAPLDPEGRTLAEAATALARVMREEQAALPRDWAGVEAKPAGEDGA